MRIGIFTSSKAISLRKVAQDLSKVFYSHGIEAEIFPTSAPLDDEVLSLDGIVITMPVDLTFHVESAYKYYRFKAMGKPAVYYATIEGKVFNPQLFPWIKREVFFTPNSRYTKAKLSEAGFKTGEVVYHGVDLKKFSEGIYVKYGGELRRSLGISENDFLIGYIASGVKRKCHDLASGVMSILKEKDPSVKLLVFTDDEGAKHYQGLDNVIVISNFGNVDDDAIITIYHALNLYAHFACAEGFGLPVLEALASGVPVIHPDYDPLSEITDENSSFRVPVESIVMYKDVSSIIYELHRYNIRDYAEMILYAKDMLKSKADEYIKASVERASQFDMYQLYKKIVRYFASV
jgi:glycosyltransferase involved in cell wall biosynthesis